MSFPTIKRYLKISFAALASVTLLPLSAFAAPIDTLHPGEWYEFPNSNMSAVDPCPHRNCVYSGISGQKGVMDAWSGGAYDTKREQLLIWGGGHKDYWGNEVYGFGPLTSATPGWKRLTEPSVAIQDNILTLTADGVLGTAYYTDGTPASRHTYTKIDYDQRNDRLMSLAGDTTNPTDSLAMSSLTTPASVSAWKSDWPPYGIINQANGGSGVYNPNDGCFYYKSAGSGPLGKFNPNANSGAGLWSYLPSKFTTFYMNPDSNIAIDTKRNHIVGIGAMSAYPNPPWYFDLNNPAAVKVNITPTGDVGGIALQTVPAPGFIYDPVGDRFIGWHGGSDVYQLDPVTFVWLKLANAAGSTVIPGASYSSYGRMRYVPGKNGFVVVSSTKTNVFFYKFTNAISPTTSTPTATLTATPTSVTTGSSATRTTLIRQTPADKAHRKNYQQPRWTKHTGGSVRQTQCILPVLSIITDKPTNITKIRPPFESKSQSVGDMGWSTAGVSQRSRRVPCPMSLKATAQSLSAWRTQQCKP